MPIVKVALSLLLEAEEQIIHKKIKFTFWKIQRNELYHTKVHPKRLHLNGTTIGFSSHNYIKGLKGTNDLANCGLVTRFSIFKNNSVET